jgi:hypothetical protein
LDAAMTRLDQNKTTMQALGQSVNSQKQSQTSNSIPRKTKLPILPQQ